MPRRKTAPIVKPMATKKLVANRKPSGPARTARTVVTGQKCEYEKCGHAAIDFRMGQHVCREHTPAGASDCTHSLGNPCAYCGHHDESRPDG